jgi:hypothetical protein
MGPQMVGQRSQRARVSPNANFTPVWTISGYGNTFFNFAMNMGRGSTANETLISITGARNWFKNIHFACYNATELDGTSHSMIELGDCSEVGFKDCYMGSDSVAMTAGTMLEYTSNTTVRAVYDNCNFVMYADTANPTFIHVKPGAGRGTSIFKNTFFLNINSSTALTVAMATSGLANHNFFFDANCGFANVTDIGNNVTAEEGSVFFQGMYYSTLEADQHTELGKMHSYDHTSG